MKHLCLLHANCHGEAIVHGLNLCPEFARRYDVKLVTNYTREPMPLELLASCDLFLYQYLKPGWGELASERLLAQLRPGARHLCIPNPYFKVYWPLWRQDPVMEYGDCLLDELVEKGLTPEEAATLYLRAPLERRVDLDGLLEASMQQERRRQQHTPVAYVDYIEEHFRRRMLFHTPNHPAAELMAHCISGILQQLGFGPLRAEAMARVSHVHPEFDLPIHPQVAQRLELGFCDADTRWNIYGTPMSMPQYSLRYAHCRANGLGSFTAFLGLENGPTL